MAAKIRSILFCDLLRCISENLASAHTGCNYPSLMRRKLTVMKKKEKNTPKHTATNEEMEHSVSGKTQDGFVKVIWQTETGSEISLLVDATRNQSD